MKKLTLGIILTLLGTAIFAQNWSGVTPGNIFYDEGHVGVGTSNPGIHNSSSSYQIYNSSDVILDVQGGNNMGWISTGSSLSTGIIGGLAFTKPNGQSDAHRQIAFIRANVTQSGQGNPMSTLEFGTKGSGGVGGPEMVINYSGDVGIGTSNPGIHNSSSSYQIYSSNDVILDVQGGNNMGWISTGSSLSTGIIGGLAFTKPNGQGDAHRQIAFIRANVTQSGQGNPMSTLEFGTKGSGGVGGPEMVINYSGDVGIGTINPDAKLAVKGTIHSEEVKVDLNVPAPDYVFEPDYQLRTLKETKEYIKENKHLPEIPSASEIGENGIDLGDMNMRLLKKIEELTLYQIELMEKLEQQNGLLQEQQNRIEKLENK